LEEQALLQRPEQANQSNQEAAEDRATVAELREQVQPQQKTPPERAQAEQERMRRLAE